MDDKKWKQMIRLALPLLFAVGCAHDRYASQTFEPIQASPLTPTSQGAAERIYSDASSPIGQYAPPPGAPANDWALAEEVRALLTSDKKLAREPMGAVVNRGVVTLQGYAPSDRDRERVEQAIASLPGVTHVDNQLVVQNILGPIRGRSNEY